jgi:Uma2 family endonuclease
MNTLTIDKTKNWTLEDFIQLGETRTPCQLINGELIMSPAPAPLHQRVLRKLFKIIDSLNLPGEIFFAPIDLYIDEKNVFQPDLVYLTSQNVSSITDRGIEGPVDLVVEIISPSNGYTDRNQKKNKYLEFGVKEYWIVDPANETIEIYTPQAGQDVPVLYLSGNGQVTSNAIPNLAFELSTIF